MSRYIPKEKPWQLPDLTLAELYALKQLSIGKANEYQQRMALTCIVTKFAGAYDMSYRPGPDGDRDTIFAEGKRFVGSRIMEAIDRPMPDLKEGINVTDPGPRPKPKQRAKPAVGPG
ncbi:MAG: hypothetical protein ACRDHG_13895 [Anaerolineales bacterium]